MIVRDSASIHHRPKGLRAAERLEHGAVQEAGQVDVTNLTVIETHPDDMAAQRRDGRDLGGDDHVRGSISVSGSMARARLQPASSSSARRPQHSKTIRTTRPGRSPVSTSPDR
jgi:hypothetical protein